MTGQLVSIAGLFERNRMVEVVSEFGFSESTEYKTVAIVGPQGCGNSTIANMLVPALPSFLVYVSIFAQ